MAKDIRVKIVGDASSFAAAVKSANDHADKLGSRMSKLAKASVLAAGGAGVGAVALGLKAGISEYIQAEKVAAQTNAVIKSTGGIAGVTAKHVDDLAQSLMRKSGVDDEAIKSGANLLLTFTNIRNVAGEGNDIFDQSTKILLDMSTALGEDASSSAIRLGKALQDPIGGVTALKRVGVQFTEVQHDQIEAMVKSGDVMGAQKKILAELNKEFGGSAEAAGKTLPGQLNKLRETFNNAAGEIVSHFAPAIQSTVERMTEWLDNTENQKRVLHDLQAAVDTTRGVIKDLTPTVEGVASAVKKMSDGLGGAKNTLLALIAVAAGWKATSLINSLNNIGVAAGGANGKGGAAGKVGGLRASLNALKTFGGITIAIELLLNTDKIDAWITKHGLPSGKGGLYGWLFGGKKGGGGVPSDQTTLAGGQGAVAKLTQGAIGSPGGMVQGRTGKITAGLGALELAVGAHVNDDFATSGHAPNSYHYKGQAADLAPDPAVWAKLFARKSMFAELLGPWGLYNWGVQFFDAKLQSQHNDHIHVAFTGGSDAIKKAFGVGGGGTAAEPTRGAAAPTSGLKPAAPKKKTGGSSGFQLSPAIQKRLAFAALTSGTKDDLDALNAAADAARKAARSKNDELAASAAEALKGYQDQIAAIETAANDKRQKKQDAAQAKARAALKAHLEQMKRLVEDRKQAFETAFSGLIDRALSSFDKETARGLSAIAAKFGGETPEEKALREFRDQQAKDQKAADREAAMQIEDANERAARLRELDLQDQEDALVAAADASRAARDQQQSDAEAAYQNQRDLQRDQLDKWLGEQQEKLENGTTQWATFWKQLVDMAGAAGLDTASAFWAQFNAAGGSVAVALGGLDSAKVGQAFGGVGTRPDDRAGIRGAGAPIPHLAKGGTIIEPGLAVVHRGETVVPAGQGYGRPVTITVNGWVGNDQDLARKLSVELSKMARRGDLLGI